MQLVLFLKHWYQVYGMLKQHPGCSHPPCGPFQVLQAQEQWDHGDVWFVRSASCKAMERKSRVQAGVNSLGDL